MIQLTNLTDQTLQPGQSVTFDKVNFHSGCGECFNSQLPTSIKLCAKCGIYDVEFHGNVTSTVAGDAVQLSLTVAGSPLLGTAMDAKPVAVGDLWNVSAGTFVRDCCGDANRVSVTNTGTTPITVAANSSFRASRRS